MAALPYMQLYVADYLADTVHLDAEQHGAYLLLMMNYWQTGKPIPKNRLQAIAKVPNDRWTTVEQALNEYFNDTGTHWQHSRIDADLQMVSDAQEQRSRAGKASAEARKRSKQKAGKARISIESNGRSTVVATVDQRLLNGRSTNKDKDTDIETESEPNGSSLSTTPNGVVSSVPSEPDPKAGSSTKPLTWETEEVIIELYHEILPELPKVIVSRWKGSKHSKSLHQRWKEDARFRTRSFWRSFFETVRTNPWWMGDANKTGESFDGCKLAWLVNRSNFDKVLDKGGFADVA